MAKITVSRLFEISKYLTTDAGKELEGALRYLSEFAEVSIRTLRNGLTFADNVDCTIKTLTLPSETVTTVAFSGSKRASYVIPVRVIDTSYWIIDQFGWSYDSNGNLQVFFKTLDSNGTSPPTSWRGDLVLLILFG